MRWIVLLVVFLLLVVPWLINPEDTKLTEEIRQTAPGQFVELNDGWVHYELGGPEEGPVLVMIAGMISAYSFWDTAFSYFTTQGYRVLRYDSYGRGYSDRPEGVDYDPQTFVRQLADLLEKLEIEEPVTLVGSSLGGAISVAFAATHPNKVRKICLQDPAGYFKTLPFELKIARIPWLGDYVFRWVYPFQIKKVERHFYDKSGKADMIEDLKKKIIHNMQFQGYGQAILQTLRNFPIENMGAYYREVQTSGIPVLILWGENDTLTPFETHTQLLKWMPGAQFVPLEKTGHVPALEHPLRTHLLLQSFLES